MKTLKSYIFESKEKEQINIIDKLATEFEENKKLSSSQLDKLSKALQYLEQIDSFEEGWIEIARDIIKKCTPSFKELTINCGYDKGKMFDYANRKIVLIDINGIGMPFYLSTGEGGKEKDGIMSGKWYPFFGIRTNVSKYGKLMHVTNIGWLRKGSSRDIKQYYDVPILKQVCDFLDNKYGDIRNKQGLPKGYEYREDETKFNQFCNAINKDLIKLVGSEEKFVSLESIYTIASKL